MMSNEGYDTKSLTDASFCPNFFAPKCEDRDAKFDIGNAHAIANSHCNFRCEFCKFGVKNKNQAYYITLKKFEDKILELIPNGRMFKFTGGEPCLNPELKNMMKIVKKNNGIVFLDSNGSMPHVIEKLLFNNLIDVLGISLKGLNPNEAIKNAGIKNEKMCWDNVIETIKLASRYSKVRLIITYVAYDDFNYEKLCKFGDMLNEINNKSYLKINNLCGKIHRNINIKALDMEKLNNMIIKFVKNNPKWKKRVILINSSEAVSKYEKILFY